MKKILERISKNFDLSTPASFEAIVMAETHFNFPFPEDYKEFLEHSNGLEGEIPTGYIVLWSAEEVLDLNQAYHVHEFVSNMIIFGSDGAEDAYAFNTSGTGNLIVRFPFIGMGHIPTQMVADSFNGFLESQIKAQGNFLKRFFT